VPILSNARHERFAQELAKGATADEAYQLAGFKANRGNASRLKANENTVARVEEILSAAARRAETTIYDIADQLDEDRQFARDLSVPGAAITATMGKAKVLGLLVDRSEVTGKDGGPIETVDRSDRDIAKDIAFVLAKGAKAQQSVN
jgi:phosphohistidine phosphatase SixA